jgi:hypothetical protein
MTIPLVFPPLTQGTSWSSLITPMQIVIPTPLQGTEIDLTSDAFSNRFDELWNGTSGIQDYSKLFVP